MECTECYGSFYSKDEYEEHSCMVQCEGCGVNLLTEACQCEPPEEV